MKKDQKAYLDKWVAKRDAAATKLAIQRDCVVKMISLVLVAKTPRDVLDVACETVTKMRKELTSLEEARRRIAIVEERGGA